MDLQFGNAWWAAHGFLKLGKSLAPERLNAILFLAICQFVRLTFASADRLPIA
jgi:hypothetical protein